MSFKLIACPSCVVVYGIPGELRECRLNDQQDVYCPNGDKWHYNAWGDQNDHKPPAILANGYKIEDFEALSGIALLKPSIFNNKKDLRTAINMARNALDLARYKEEK